MSDEAKLDNILDSFFNKIPCKTSHETLANYEKGVLEAGGTDGVFYTHICYHTVRKALFELIEQKANGYTIVETGCSAHGIKSTLLWDKFVNCFGGKVVSVDRKKRAVDTANSKTSSKTNVVNSDSLKFLPTIAEKIDFLYMQSSDVDFLNPLPSAKHHLEEFSCVRHLLHKGSIVLINDTPVNPEWLDDGKNSPHYHGLRMQFDENMTGKGSLVSQELEKMGETKVMHQYQVLWKIVNHHSFFAKFLDLTKCNSKKYSEHYQDSILEEIFSNIDFTENRFFVEFGSNGCKFGGGNTAYLRERFGMKGLLMDGSENPYGIESKEDFERKVEFITAENINDLFQKYDIPDNIDFLSIDVDGEDYWIMDSLDIKKYRPRVICIETNWHMHPDLKLAQRHNPNHVWQGHIFFGCSSRAILDLLKKRNYSMVAYTGPDCIFVHNDEIRKNNLIFNGQDNLIELGVLKGPIRANSHFINDPFWTKVD